MVEEIIYSAAHGVAQIRISRADKKNALTASMYAALADAIVRAEADSAVRAIVILGSQGAFTAGNDLQEFLQDPPIGLDRPVYRFMAALAGAEKVVIAGVAGLAVGIGTTLLLHCDLVVAGLGARFSLPFVNLGLVPEFASSLLLPQLIGRQLAGKHLLLAEPFDAATALAYGIVSEVVDNAEVDTVALEWASRVAAKAPGAVRETKRLLKPDALLIAQRITAEATVFSAQLSSQEAREALSAFVEKRAPRFDV
ncbi:MAG: enoyl-CoA hydratase [Phenylobacterium sp.]|uniref:enoyl-CoA hydratase n=1 Tax=Phenylobacterium sp. TaxID=1871053 RepID=UPI0027339403|nr:enoyl-CoA hydratase [Phenylobacterium sp.]MDP3749600.1 enoyl-CoA hydratase [Phenylobacterium sp.]